MGWQIVCGNYRKDQKRAEALKRFRIEHCPHGLLILFEPRLQFGALLGTLRIRLEIRRHCSTQLWRIDTKIVRAACIKLPQLQGSVRNILQRANKHDAFLS